MNNLKQKFIMPPFSVLDTKQIHWQNRKRKWLSLGIKSELGRDATCLPIEFDEKKYGKKMNQGTSIFDPVLCEIMYKWFCPNEGKILDPCAGGSVRGIVATNLNYKYVGIELRKEQVNSNIEQATKIGLNPKWIIGDGRKTNDYIKENDFDMIFTCPPYWNLEIYSDKKEDLSNAETYNDFLKMCEEIFISSASKLKNNRFAIFVVSNFRDKNGYLYDFVGDTIRIAQRNNLKFYNEIILVNAIGTLPIRTAAIFPDSRKVGKMHQNVLVFYKGWDTSHLQVIFEQKKEKIKSLVDF